MCSRGNPVVVDQKSGEIYEIYEQAVQKNEELV